MKKKLILFPIFAALSLGSCSISDLFSSSETKVNTDSNLETTETGATEHAGSDFDYTTPVTVTKPEEIVVEETDADFSIVTSKGGTYSQEGDVYTLLTAGTYTLSGKLEGQILVNAGEEDKESNFVVKKNNKGKIQFEFSNTLDKDDETDIKQITERFYRAPSNKKEGSGIGLSIAQEVVNLHKGKIKVAKTNNALIFNIIFE